MGQHALRLAADEQAAEPASAVRRHEDHVAAAPLRGLDDAEIGRRMHARRRFARDARAARGRLHFVQMHARLALAALAKISGRLDHDFGKRRVRILRQARVGRHARAHRLREIDRAVDGLLRQLGPVGRNQDVLEHGDLRRQLRRVRPRAHPRPAVGAGRPARTPSDSIVVRECTRPPSPEGSPSYRKRVQSSPSVTHWSANSAARTTPAGAARGNAAPAAMARAVARTSSPIAGAFVRVLQEIEKEPDPERQVPALRKHRVNADRRRGERVEHADEPARRDVRADFPPRAPCEAMALEAPFVQHRAVRALHRAGHADRHHLAAVDEAPAALLVRVRREREAVVAREIVERPGHAGAREIGRRRDAHAPVLAELERHERRIGQLAQAHRAIEPLVDEVDHPVGQIERDRHVRVRARKRGYERRDVAPAEARGRRHPQMPARLHAARGHARLGVLHVVDDALAILEERRAFERQRELARGAHEQLHAEPLLERVKPAADDRGRDPFRMRGRRQAAFRRNRGERFDLFEAIHPVCGRRAPAASSNPKSLQIRYRKVKDQVMITVFFSSSHH
ncbi:hypothetical protein DM50_4157 [Burkholderia mallei]|nr:hypothetical protein DM50_4157 [Burkholderia mallei]